MKSVYHFLRANPKELLQVVVFKWRLTELNRTVPFHNNKSRRKRKRRKRESLHLFFLISPVWNVRLLWGLVLRPRFFSICTYSQETLFELMILNIIYLNSLKTLKCSCLPWTSPLNSKVIYPTAHSTPPLECLTVSFNLTQGPALRSAFSILVNGKSILWAAQTQNMTHDFPSCSSHTPQGIHQKILLAVFSKYIQELTISYYVYQSTDLGLHDLLPVINAIAS